MHSFGEELAMLGSSQSGKPTRRHYSEEFTRDAVGRVTDHIMQTLTIQIASNMNHGAVGQFDLQAAGMACGQYRSINVGQASSLSISGGQLRMPAPYVDVNTRVIHPD